MTTILLKTTEEIFKNPWSNVGNLIDTPPKIENWDYTDVVSISTVNLWETLFFQPGNIGIYASWDPYIEYYILTHNLFLDFQPSILEFYGSGSNKQIIQKCKDLKIEITPNSIWVDSDNSWLYD